MIWEFQTRNVEFGIKTAGGPDFRSWENGSEHFIPALTLILS